MEMQEYYKKQIKHDLIEKFNITRVDITSIITHVDLLYKTRKIMTTPYTLPFLLKRQYMLESFTKTTWSSAPLYYPKPGRSVGKTGSFSVVFKNKIATTFGIYELLLLIYIFIIGRNRSKKTYFRCCYNVISKEMILILTRINLAPWIPITIRHLISMNRLIISFHISNPVLFKSLFTRLQLNRYIKYKINY